MTTVINAGIAGNNTRDLLVRFERDVAGHDPDLVILGVGSNDALNSRNPVPLAEYAENIRRLIILAKGIGAGVTVLIPLPCYDPYVLERHSSDFFGAETPSEKLENYCQILREICNERNVAVIDVRQHFIAHGSIGTSSRSWLRNEANCGTRDGTHPTEAGFRELAHFVFQAIKTNDQSAQKLVCFGDSITYGGGEEIKPGQVMPHSYPAILRTLLLQGL